MNTGGRVIAQSHLDLGTLAERLPLYGPMARYSDRSVTETIATKLLRRWLATAVAPRDALAWPREGASWDTDPAFQHAIASGFGRWLVSECSRGRRWEVEPSGGVGKVLRKETGADSIPPDRRAKFAGAVFHMINVSAKQLNPTVLKAVREAEGEVGFTVAESASIWEGSIAVACAGSSPSHQTPWVSDLHLLTRAAETVHTIAAYWEGRLPHKLTNGTGPYSNTFRATTCVPPRAVAFWNEHAIATMDGIAADAGRVRGARSAATLLDSGVEAPDFDRLGAALPTFNAFALTCAWRDTYMRALKDKLEALERWAPDPWEVENLSKRAAEEHGNAYRCLLIPDLGVVR